MKDDQIVELFSKWQTRLKLNHWDLKLGIVNSGELSDDAGGYAKTDFQYLNAEIQIARNDNKRDLTHMVIHELLHLHLAGLNIIEGTPAHMAEEQAIQILSRVIFDGYEK